MPTSTRIAAPPPAEVLDEPAWTARVETHEARLRPLLDPYLDRRSRGHKDPVLDFLFEYYAFRPSHLLRWSPGLGVALQGEAAEAFLQRREFARSPDGVMVDPGAFPERRLPAARWTRTLLANTAARPPFFGCGGMHEWAMVYRSEDVRHGQLPLRMPPDELAAFVESRPIVCSHFDAFRFFTEPARVFNRHQPTRETMPNLEQPGCLHANMDVYRWAFKLYPFVEGELLADAFLLAVRIREVDMRASPYDLSAYGYEPIRVETAEGRRAYQDYQQRFYDEAVPLRRRLIAAYDRLLDGAVRNVALKIDVQHLS